MYKGTRTCRYHRRRLDAEALVQLVGPHGNFKEAVGDWREWGDAWHQDASEHVAGEPRVVDVSEVAPMAESSSNGIFECTVLVPMVG